MKKMITYLGLLFFVLMFAQHSMAQNPGDPGNGDDPDGAIPIDGGLFTVLGAGLTIGAYKLVKSKKE